MPSQPGLNRIRVRAMNRALARLRNLHRDEYDALYAEEFDRAQQEAAEHLATVEHEHADESPPVKAAGEPGPKHRILSPVPPKLMPGPRDTPQLREDVARCPYCQRYHGRGYECSSCRHRPAGALPPNPYRRLA